MSSSWLALALCSCITTGCITGAALDWCHPEVAIVGAVRSATPGSIDAIRLDVKNVEAVRDGHYLIRLPKEWTLETARSASAAPDAPIELPLEFERKRPFFVLRNVEALAVRHFRSSCPIQDKRGPVGLRADVQRDDAGILRIAFFGDVRHDAHWALLATAPIGRGTQGPRRGLARVSVLVTGILGDAVIIGGVTVGVVALLLSHLAAV